MRGIDTHQCWPNSVSHGLLLSRRGLCGFGENIPKDWGGGIVWPMTSRSFDPIAQGERRPNLLMMSRRNDAFNGSLMVSVANVGILCFAPVAMLVSTSKGWTTRETGFVLASSLLGGVLSPLATVSLRRFGVVTSAIVCLVLIVAFSLMLGAALLSSSNPVFGSPTVVALLAFALTGVSDALGVVCDLVVAVTVPSGRGDRGIALSISRAVTVRSIGALVLVAAGTSATLAPESASLYVFSIPATECVIAALGLWWMRPFFDRQADGAILEYLATGGTEAGKGTPRTLSRLSAFERTEPPPNSPGESERLRIAWWLTLAMNTIVPGVIAAAAWQRATYLFIIVLVVVVLQIVAMALLPWIVERLATLPLLPSVDEILAATELRESAVRHQRVIVATTTESQRLLGGGGSSLSLPDGFAPLGIWWVISLSGGTFVAVSCLVLLAIPAIPYALPSSASPGQRFTQVPGDVIVLTAALGALSDFYAVGCLLLGRWMHDTSTTSSDTVPSGGLLGCGRPLAAVLASGTCFGLSSLALALLFTRTSVLIAVPVLSASLGVYTLGKTTVSADLFPATRFALTEAVVRLVGAVGSFVILALWVIPAQERHVAGGNFAVYAGERFCLGGPCLTPVFYVTAITMIVVCAADIAIASWWWMRHKKPHIVPE